MSMEKPNLDFKTLFLKGEKKEIQGHNQINMKILLGILLITFISTGTSNIVLKDLNAKMNDPFVNLFSIEVPYSKQYVVNELKEDFQNAEKQKEFGFQSISNYSEFPLSFRKLANDGEDIDLWVKGRSIDLESPILDALLGPDNLILGSAYEYSNEPSIVVTEKLFKSLGYEKLRPYIDMTFDGKVIPVPVKAIVKDLPESNSFLALPFFYFQRIENGARPFKEVESITRLVLYHPDPDRKIECLSFLKEFIAKKEMFNPYELDIYVESNRSTYVTGLDYTVKIFGYKVDNARGHDTLVKELLQSSDIFEFTRIYKLDYSKVDNLELSTDRLAVNFTNLDNIRNFRNSLFNKYQIEMDLARVIDKENFQLFNILTQGISYALIAFSLAGICFYLYNMIKSHLEKIKRNLGTFLAFGLDPKELYNLYQELLFDFLNKSVVIAFIIGFLVVSSLSYFSSEGLSLMILIEWKTLIVLISLYGAFYTIYRLTIFRLLERTPGDLVYERE